MTTIPSIPPATAEKLNAIHPVGTRHTAARDIAFSLIGQGMSTQAVFAELRAKFPPDVSDLELQNLVNGAVAKNPQPSGYGTYQPTKQFYRPVTQQPTAQTKPTNPIDHCKWWLSELELTPQQITEQSPTDIPEDLKQWMPLMLDTLYTESEFVNVVCAHIVNEGKANPKGGGKSLTPADWKQWIAKHGQPQSEAGAWVRPNPCKQIGSGANGAICDADVTTHRFLLVESDILPLPIQLALYSKLKLPVALIVTSGGHSAHAWMRLDSKDKTEYDATSKRILDALASFGVDQANKNPSRLSRLAGATRKIGAKDDGIQRLLWINTHCEPLDLQAFEDSLTLPVIEEQPFKRLMLATHSRYDELIKNKGKLGVPSGLYEFDRDSGGFKKGQMTIISGETNSGKSTVAINFINTALLNDIGVAFFTLEMDKDEITDLLVSMNCNINRNHFNTGNFTDEDITSVINNTKRLCLLPLYLDDSPTLTAGQIRRRVIQLVKEKRIGLVVIDYAQIVSPDDPREPREQQVARIARELRALAKESRLPIIVLSQLNDEGKLRESRVLAHEAHNVMHIETGTKEGQPTMKIRITKGRSIPKRNYELEFQPLYCKVLPEYGEKQL